MKILALSLLVCAVMPLTRGTTPEAEDEYSVSEDEYWTELTTPDETTTGYGMVTEGGWHFSCPDGWSMYSTQCVLFVSRNMTWNEALDNCRSMGGNLASVLFDEQAHDIYNEMQKAGDVHSQVWVGGHKTPENPSWSWIDDWFNVFHNWCDEEDAEHMNDCLQITFEEYGSGCLDDMQCDALLPSVCGMILL
ncbi:Type-2 ice-structuring protein Type II antifreeze protein [Channa argus]|uniref:Type-2 ice-structuring protein Type II antifreeze protein n=1 Tax=Channa argus TaxID=215402 RepID=A0A6G1Q664_CHAAH|nr:Type-2 ice-structuring protein Type II antifreeze protein [Channa argus]